MYKTENSLNKIVNALFYKRTHTQRLGAKRIKKKIVSKTSTTFFSSTIQENINNIVICEVF